MKTTFLLLLLLQLPLELQAQISFSYALSVSAKNHEVNRKIIEANFGPPTPIKKGYLWVKNGPGYRYKIQLKPQKITIKYTGKAKQMERKIKALRKKIIRH